MFGAAILDNIDVNGTLVGEGSVTANNSSFAEGGSRDGSPYA